MNQTIYCVYLTHYTGDKLPPYYVGSSSVKRVEDGYRGTVLSKKWKETWNSELSNNKKHFKTIIISYHSTRESALREELRFQKEMNVVKSKQWINESYAMENGCFGRDVSGELNPMFGGHTKETVQKLKDAGTLFGYGQKMGGHLHRTQETFEKMVKTRRERNNYLHTEETKKKISKPGSSNPRAKRIEFRGQIYGCLKECSELTGVSLYHIRKEMTEL